MTKTACFGKMLEIIELIEREMFIITQLKTLLLMTGEYHQHIYKTITASTGHFAWGGLPFHIQTVLSQTYSYYKYIFEV